MGIFNWKFVGKNIVGDDKIICELPIESRMYGNLIATAPRLLFELKRVVQLLEPLEEAGKLDTAGLRTLTGARYAISLARGEVTTPPPPPEPPKDRTLKYH
jgi:hypothetical protein